MSILDGNLQIKRSVTHVVGYCETNEILIFYSINLNELFTSYQCQACKT